MNRNAPVRAWRCEACTCLTVRRVTEPEPRRCDRCTGPLRPYPLRRPEETR